MSWSRSLLGPGSLETPPSRLGLLLMTAGKLGPGRCFSACRGRRSMGMSLLLPRLRLGRWGLVVERELELGVAQVVVAGCAGGDGAFGGSVLGGSDGGAAGGRGYRDEWEDDHCVPDPGDARGGWDPVRAAGDREAGGRWGGGGGRADDAGGDRPAGDLPADAGGGDRACAMEVSSHALALHRCDAIHFEVALFTNLTQDHLDFHGDMEDYFRSKRMLFEMGPGSRSSTSTTPTAAAWPRNSSA